MDDADVVDTQQLAALEEQVAALMAQETDLPPESRDRVAAAVLQAQADLVLRDTFSLVAGRMWGALAALLAPIFVLFTGSKS